VHPHLPHFERLGDAVLKMDVLARQRIDLTAPAHPFIHNGRATFDALLYSGIGVFTGDVLVGDATLWSSTAGGLDSLRRLWTNIVQRPASARWTTSDGAMPRRPSDETYDKQPARWQTPRSPKRRDSLVVSPDATSSMILSTVHSKREDGVAVSERDDIVAIVSRHLALWSVKDDDLRLSEINDVYGEELEVIEPTGLPLGPGRLGLHEHIGLLQKLLGDFTFEVDGDIDTHHGWATYAWVQRPPYNGRTVTGREVIHVVDGRIVFLFMVIHDLEFPEPPAGVSS
jgi:hypothetical protein